MNKKRIEIIDVKLDINIAEEIRKKVDSLNSEIVEHTRKVIEKRGMKVQRINKRQKAKKERTEKVALVVKFLEESLDVPDLWIKGKTLLEIAGLEVTPQNINKLSMQIRRFLEIEDKWTLSKKRKSGRTVYRLIKFS